MSLGNCKDCLYYYQHEGSYYHQPENSWKGKNVQFTGWCRMNPKPIPTSDNDYCGKYKYYFDGGDQRKRLQGGRYG